MERGPVLIVEDDRELRDALAAVLENTGYAVQVAENGAEAIDMLEHGMRPCAVLVDLVMPGIVGQELLEVMRSDQELATIPVAITSGSPELAPPGYKVFPKPLDVRALVGFVGEASHPG